MSVAEEEFELSGLTADSRQVKEGYLFAALPGTQVDGRDYIDQAIAQGAIAILAPEGTRLKDYGRPVMLICDRNPRKRLSQMAARFYQRQPRCLVAVTGTNGKTSSAWFARHIWQGLQIRAACMGTLGLIPAHPDFPSKLTTPETVEMMKQLARLKCEGVEHLAMEASSHGLDQYRLDGLRVSAAAFTNLSRDHLDYHADMESYFAAKSRLFSEVLVTGGTAVLNADVPEFEALAEICARRGHRVLSYGTKGQDLKLLKLTPLPQGLDMEIEVMGVWRRLILPLAGNFQAMNVLCALGLVLAEEIPVTKALDQLPDLPSVPGRLELIGATPAGGQIYVDFAHTPDALISVLTAMRDHTPGRLACIYGCGGDRDRGKRPLMAEAVLNNADIRILTDDNPRSEDPAQIREDALKGDPDAHNVGDRRKAIAFGAAQLQAGDVLVIAGKGHESGQTIGDQVIPFDDRDVVREILTEMKAAEKEEACA